MKKITQLSRFKIRWLTNKALVLMFLCVLFPVLKGQGQTYTHTGSTQTLTLPAGSYQIEMWGADGERAVGHPVAGIGGYSKGIYTIASPTTIYIGVGGKGILSPSTNAFAPGGWNGGGQGYGSTVIGGGGGGASHIATATGTLPSLSGNQSAVVIVAGGGGGSGYNGAGGNGGGLAGGNGTSGTGGTVGGTFGQGANGVSGSTVGGGGGGWFGGNLGNPGNTGGSGGGSGYIGGVTNGVTIMFGQPGFVPNPDTTGNGLVVITSMAPCAGTPTVGTATATSRACASQPFTLSVTGATNGGGITYKWQRSDAGANNFTDIPGATNLSYIVTNQTVNSDYRFVVTCTNSNNTSTSNIVNVVQPAAAGNFTENFDTTPVGAASDAGANWPTCWSYIDGIATTGYANVSATNAQSAPHSYRMYRTNTAANQGDNLILISPQTDNLGNGTKQLRFSVLATAVTTPHYLEIVRANGTVATSTFTVINRININTTTYKEYIVPLPVTTDDYFGFRLVHNGTTTASTIHLDDVHYEDLSPCIFPMNIRGTNIVRTGLDISWDASLAPGVTGYEYEVRTSGAPGSGAVGRAAVGSTTGATTATVTGLTGGVTYYVYVRSVCGTSKGEWSMFPFIFDTLCPLMTGNFTENFDTTPVGANSDAGANWPNCWSYIDGITTTGYGNVSATNAQSTPNSYRMYRTNTTANQLENLTLISPETVDLGNGTKQLRFSARAVSVTTPHYLEIVRVNGTTANDNFTVMATVNVDATTYKEYIVPLPVTTDDYFGFRLIHNGTTTASTIHLDDIFYEDLSACMYPGNILATSITTTSATITWDPSYVAGVTAYEYEVRTSGAAGSGNTGLVTSGTTTGTSVNVSGLNVGAQYIVYVRSICGTTNGRWTLFPLKFYTLCGIVGNFYENFDTTNPGTLDIEAYPHCWGYIDNVTTTGYGYVENATAQSTPNSFRLYRTNTATNQAEYVALVSPQTDNLGNGKGNKQVRFSAMATTTNASNLLVIGTSNGQTAGSTFTALDTIVVNHTGYQEYTVMFPQTTDDYFVFRLVHNGTTAVTDINIDDVYYEDAPTCKAVLSKDITVSNVLKNSADISWIDNYNTNISYQVEVRETGNPGTPGAAFIGVTPQGINFIKALGLSPSTRYNIYVKAICSPTDSGDWSDGVGFNTLCDYPNLLSQLGTTICGMGSVDLTATFNKGTVQWYDAPIDGNLVHTGSTFSTPVLSNNTSYWVTAQGDQPTSSFVGRTNLTGLPGETSSGTGGGLTTYMSFSANSDFILETVDLFPNGTSAGTVVIELRTDTGVPIMSKTFNVTGNNVNTAAPQTVTLDFPIQGGVNYRLGVNSWSGGVTNLWRNDLGASNSYYPVIDTNNQITITGNSLDNRYWYFFYNWKISGAPCESPRIEVPVTVLPAPVFELSNYNVASCEGTASPVVNVTSNLGGYDTFVWTPNTGVSGNASNGWTFTTSHDQEYKLLVSQSTGLCKIEKTVHVLAGKQPQPLPTLASNYDLCKGEVKEFKALEALPSSVAIGTGLTTTAAASEMSAFVQSNVYSKQQYIYSAAELVAQGLTTAGYIKDLSFEIINSGASLTNPKYTVKMMLVPNTTFVNTNFITGNLSTVYSKVNHTHTFQGIQNIVFDSPFYWDGQSNVLVELTQEGVGSGNNAQTYFTSVTGSNVGLYTTSDSEQNPVSGTQTTNRLDVRFRIEQSRVTWTPASNLYIDSAATIPYVAGTNALKVYFTSGASTTQSYNALLTSPSGCSSTKAIAVNVADITTPVVQNQTFCQATPVTNVIVTGGSTATFNFYNSVTATTPITTISQTGTYYVEATQGLCKSTRIPFTATITPLGLPTAQFTQVVCGSGTISSLQASGVNGSQIKWYNSATSVTPLASTQTLTDNTTYYASQTLGACESGRISVLVDINPAPAALTPQTISLCGALNYGNVNLNQIAGSELVWYPSGTSQTPISNTAQIVNGTYYVSQKVNGCESLRVQIIATTQGSVPAPTAGIQNICGNGTVAQLIAQILPNATAEWYSNATATTPLTSITPLVNGTYYVSQRVGNCASVKIPVAVRLISTSAPAVSSISLCAGSKVGDLNNSLPTPTGTTYKWYLNSTATTELPVTDVLASGYYFVTRVENGCESGRTQVQVTINSRPNSPTGASPQTFTDYAEISYLVMSQTNVVWYITYDDAMKGVNPLAGNMPLVHGTTYYAVVIGANGCPSLPTPIEAIIVLGVNDFDLSKLKYYPNPVNDLLTITYTDVITNVEVFDLNGRMVIKRDFDNQTVQLDFSSLSAGTYMLNIKTKENSQFVKIVKK